MAGIADLLPVPEPVPGAPAAGRVFKVERGAAGEKVAYVRMFTGSVWLRQRLDLPDGRLGKVAGVQLFEAGRWARARRGRRRADRAAARPGRGPGRRRVRRAARRRRPPLPAAHPRGVGDSRPPRARDRPSRAALTTLADQDPLIDARTDEDGQVVVSLYGRVQQEVLAATLAEEYGVEAAFSDASVMHVERPRGSGPGVERFNTPSNPHHATLGLRIAPGPPGSGLSSSVDVSGHGDAAVPVQERRGVLHRDGRHVAHALDHGLFGWQVTDCRVTVTDIAYTLGGRAAVEAWSAADRSRLPEAHPDRPAPGSGPGRRPRVRAGPRVDPRGADRRARPRSSASLGRWGAALTDQTSRGDYPRSGAAARRPGSTSSSASFPT